MLLYGMVKNSCNLENTLQYKQILMKKHVILDLFGIGIVMFNYFD